MTEMRVHASLMPCPRQAAAMSNQAPLGCIILPSLRRIQQYANSPLSCEGVERSVPALDCGFLNIFIEKLVYLFGTFFLLLLSSQVFPHHPISTIQEGPLYPQLK